MNYTRIDLNEWSRGGLFRYYMEKSRIITSMTVEIDVRKLKAYAKRTGLGFYPLMLWAVSKAVNAHDEFRYGWDGEGHLILWDEVWPSYTDFHAGDESFTKMVTEYCDDPAEFCARVAADRERVKNDRGVLAGQPRNIFDASCLPWVKYQHIDIHVYDEGAYLAPVIIWGKYEEAADGRLLMPLTMNVHHAVADGFHMSRFFNEVQETIDSLG